MSLPTKAVLHAATYPRDPRPGTPCNITIAQFNDWLAEEHRHAKARALEEAAEAWDNGTVDHFEIKHSSDAPLGWSDESVVDAVMSSGPVMDWLRNRANNLKDNQ